MSTLKDSFIKSLLKEKPTITPEEIKAEWDQFQQEYSDYNAEIAAQYARGESA